MSKAHKTPCNDMSCPQTVCENRHKDLPPLRQSDSSTPAPSPSEGELNKAIAWAENGQYTCACGMAERVHPNARVLLAAYRSLLAERVKMEAVVEAAGFVSKAMKVPGFAAYEVNGVDMEHLSRSLSRLAELRKER